MKRIHIKYKLYSKNLKFSPLIDVNYNVKYHIINQNYHITLKLDNKYTMIIGSKFILL